MENILKQLSISNINYGACIGGDSWMETKDQGTIESVNPSNGNIIANVHKCSETDYEKVITDIIYSIYIFWKELHSEQIQFHF